MVQAQVFNRAQYVSRADAKKVFSAYKNGGQIDEFATLTMRVARQTGKGNISAEQILNVAKTLDGSGVITLYPSSLKPTNAKKTAYSAALLLDAAIALPVLGRAIEYIGYYGNKIQGMDASDVGDGIVLAAAVYGVYKAAKELITSWRNEARNSLDKLAYNLEQAILNNLPK